MGIGEWIVIGLCVVFGGAYLWGASANRGLAETSLRWLRPGLRRLGERPQAAPLGRLASGARYLVDPAHKPFLRAEVQVRIAPRENPPYWLFQRLRGRRDELVLQAHLRKPPAQEFEVGKAEDGDYRGVVSSQGKEPFELVPTGEGWEIARRGRKDAGQLEALREFVEQRRGALIRLSLRKEAPHLVLRARLRQAQEETSEALVEAMAKMLGED